MKITTERFGTIDLPCEQLFLFPRGLIGLENRRQWALLPDADNPALAWLQSTARGELALPVISPRAFFDDYKARVSQRDLTILQLRRGNETFILTTVAIHDAGMTTNLRAPIILNMEKRLGAQLVTNDEQPIRQPMPVSAASGPVISVAMSDVRNDQTSEAADGMAGEPVAGEPVVSEPVVSGQIVMPAITRQAA